MRNILILAIFLFSTGCATQKIVITRVPAEQEPTIPAYQGSVPAGSLSTGRIDVTEICGDKTPQRMVIQRPFLSYVANFIFFFGILETQDLSVYCLPKSGV